MMMMMMMMMMMLMLMLMLMNMDFDMFSVLEKREQPRWSVSPKHQPNHEQTPSLGHPFGPPQEPQENYWRGPLGFVYGGFLK